MGTTNSPAGHNLLAFGYLVFYGAGEIGERRLSAGVGERQVPEATYSSGMLLMRTERGGEHDEIAQELGKLKVILEFTKISDF